MADLSHSSTLESLQNYIHKKTCLLASIADGHQDPSVSLVTEGNCVIMRRRQAKFQIPAQITPAEARARLQVQYCQGAASEEKTCPR